MNRTTRCVAGLMLALAAFPSGSGARELLDASGIKVVLKDHPRRIVTLTPALAEFAADFCGDDLSRIVGVSSYSDYPPALSKVKTIATANHVSLEAIIALKPDLVLASRDGNAADQISHLRELGLPVAVVADSSLAEIEKTARLVGAAMGEEKQGEQTAARLERGFERFRERAAGRAARGRARPRVLLEVGENPLVVAGGHTFLTEELEALGAVNVYADSRRPYPQPSLEDAIRKDPDAIIMVMGNGDDLSLFAAMAESWKRFSRMKAVKTGRVRILPADTILRPATRILEGMSLLEKALYEPK